jgi:hypothetical protein
MVRTLQGFGQWDLGMRGQIHSLSGPVGSNHAIVSTARRQEWWITRISRPILNIRDILPILCLMTYADEQAILCLKELFDGARVVRPASLHGMINAWHLCASIVCHGRGRTSGNPL